MWLNEVSPASLILFSNTRGSGINQDIAFQYIKADRNRVKLYATCCDSNFLLDLIQLPYLDTSWRSVRHCHERFFQHGPESHNDLLRDYCVIAICCVFLQTG